LGSAGFFSSITTRRQAVDEQHQVRPPDLLAVDGELLDRKQIIRAGEVDHWHAEHGTPSIRFHSLKRHTVAQPVVHLAVAVDQGLRAETRQLGGHLIDLRGRERWIQASHRVAQPWSEHNLYIAIARR
jgi:hypothetical protein